MSGESEHKHLQNGLSFLIFCFVDVSCYFQNWFDFHRSTIRVLTTFLHGSCTFGILQRRAKILNQKCKFVFMLFFKRPECVLTFFFKRLSAVCIILLFPIVKLAFFNNFKFSFLDDQHKLFHVTKRGVNVFNGIRNLLIHCWFCCRGIRLVMFL